MTGGGRAPAVAHERAEKQDLGLDASSHFAGEGVLHSLTSPARSRRGGCGWRAPGLRDWAFVWLAFPHLSGNRMFSFTFLTLFSLLVNMCCLAAQRDSLQAYRKAPAHRRKTQKRASGCWVQRRLKGWNEKGVICSPLDFLLPPSQERGDFQVAKITPDCTSKAARIPKHNNKSRTERQKCDGDKNNL